MTFREKAIELMRERGMFPEDAEKVFEAVKAEKVNAAMEGRWNDDISNYSQMMVTLLWMSVR